MKASYSEIGPACRQAGSFRTVGFRWGEPGCGLPNTDHRRRSRHKLASFRTVGFRWTEPGYGLPDTDHRRRSRHKLASFRQQAFSHGRCCPAPFPRLPILPKFPMALSRRDLPTGRQVRFVRKGNCRCDPVPCSLSPAAPGRGSTCPRSATAGQRAHTSTYINYTLKQLSCQEQNPKIRPEWPPGPGNTRVTDTRGVFPVPQQPFDLSGSAPMGPAPTGSHRDCRSYKDSYPPSPSSLRLCGSVVRWSGGVSTAGSLNVAAAFSRYAATPASDRAS